ncbi:MAG: ABC transporter substrate-binding protein [Deltaproteobacteria bacterium]|nr:ABC transporter substrate-binding protein [Deltaproteobacteria bacterium]
MKLTLAHSPDADDAFMFYPLFEGKVDLQGLEFEEVREDIETLNRKSEEGAYDISAISLHVYPAIQGNYLLLPTGACFGEKYGPVLVSNRQLKPRQVLRLRCAIPGKRTTAFLVLKFWERAISGEGRSGVSYTEVPFDQVMEKVAAKQMDLGLVIHEGQLTYTEKGLFKVVDLGEWWYSQTELPLPLGAIVVRRGLDWETQKKVSEVIQSSIRYALEHKEEAVAYALPFARGLDQTKAAEFIGKYVNEMTVAMGRRGLKAIRALFERGYRNGALSRRVDMTDAILSFKKGVESEPGEMGDVSHETVPSEVPGETPSEIKPEESH